MAGGEQHETTAMNEPTDDKHSVALRERLDHEAAELDPDVARELRLARHRALEAAPPRRRSTLLWGAAVAASVVAVTVSLRLGDTTRAPGSDVQPVVADLTPGADAVIADLDLLSAEEDLSLLEDLEFLAWLSASEQPIS